MANAIVTSSDLPVVNSLAATDYVMVIANVSGNAQTSIITVPKLLGNSGGPLIYSNTLTIGNSTVNVFINSTSITSNTIIVSNNTTPANSTASVTSRSIWFDNDYIYVAIGNNSIKRVSLNTF